jgi:hypothetical protein
MSIDEADSSTWGILIRKGYYPNRSEMWDHFLQFSLNKRKVSCLHCKKVISLGKDFSTGKMQQHMNDKHTSIRISSLRKEREKSDTSKLLTKLESINLILYKVS